MIPLQHRAFGPGATGNRLGFPPPGEGPRTALALRGGVPDHLAEHLHRLRAGAEALGQDILWLAEAGEALRAWLDGAGEAALRLALHLDLQVLSARLEPLPLAPSPCRLAPLPHPMGDLRPSPLARHKGLSGPWRSVAMASARERGAEDALLFWPDGTLAETPIAAVALERDGILTLPPPEGRVDSLTERLDLPGWAAERGWRLASAPLTLAACGEGRLWCMNALRGLWPAALL